MIELQADVELKDTIMVAMPKVAGEGFYTCNIRVEYEKKPPRYACCKVFGRIQEECPKYISAGEVKNLKKPTQTPIGVLVGLKVGFKSVKQVYRPIFKKPSANTSENQKKTYNLLKRLIIDGKVTFANDEGKPLDKIDSSGDYDSEDEVALVDNEMATIAISCNPVQHSRTKHIDVRCHFIKEKVKKDSDHAGCLDSRKSTSGGIQFLGGDKLVSWSSKKQDCTLISSAEAEYVSLSAYCAQVLGMRTQLTDYDFHFDKIPMYCDSKAAIAISCNPVQHSRTKHINVRYHFIKEQVEKGIVELFFVGTEYQLADLFTKALHVERFKYLVRRLGMRCLTPEELEALANESA
nr:retrovirus-related Pol polyprotein from transposon TNT 1-94 [Tanacetum cinerariifolium]